MIKHGGTEVGPPASSMEHGGMEQRQESNKIAIYDTSAIGRFFGTSVSVYDTSVASVVTGQRVSKRPARVQ